MGRSMEPAPEIGEHPSPNTEHPLLLTDNVDEHAIEKLLVDLRKRTRINGPRGRIGATALREERERLLARRSSAGARGRAPGLRDGHRVQGG